MPIRFERVRDGEIDLLVQIDGRLTLDEMRDYLTAVTREGSLDGERFLIEVDDLKLPGIAPHVVRSAAEMSRQFEDQLRNSRTAVVTRDPAAFGLTRMFIALRDPPYPFSLFRDRETAVDWLNGRSF